MMPSIARPTSTSCNLAGEFDSTLEKLCHAHRRVAQQLRSVRNIATAQLGKDTSPEARRHLELVKQAEEFISAISHIQIESSTPIALGTNTPNAGRPAPRIQRYTLMVNEQIGARDAQGVSRLLLQKALEMAIDQDENWHAIVHAYGAPYCLGAATGSTPSREATSPRELHLFGKFCELEMLATFVQKWSGPASTQPAVPCVTDLGLDSAIKVLEESLGQGAELAPATTPNWLAYRYAELIERIDADVNRSNRGAREKCVLQWTSDTGPTSLLVKLCITMDSAAVQKCDIGIRLSGTVLALVSEVARGGDSIKIPQQLCSIAPGRELVESMLRHFEVPESPTGRVWAAKALRAFDAAIRSCGCADEHRGPFPHTVLFNRVAVAAATAQAEGIAALAFQPEYACIKQEIKEKADRTRQEDCSAHERTLHLAREVLEAGLVRSRNSLPSDPSHHAQTPSGSPLPTAAAVALFGADLPSSRLVDDAHVPSGRPEPSVGPDLGLAAVCLQRRSAPGRSYGGGQGGGESFFAGALEHGSRHQMAISALPQPRSSVLPATGPSLPLWPGQLAALHADAAPGLSRDWTPATSRPMTATGPTATKHEIASLRPRSKQRVPSMPYLPRRRSAP